MTTAALSKGTLRVLVCDDLSEEGLALFKPHPNITVEVKTKLPLDALKKEIADADACIVRSATKITAEVIEAARKLKIIGRAGVGLDNVDVDAASKRGIIVINTPGGNTVSAAELTFALLMALARNIARANDSMKKGEWERKKFTGVELSGKTLGIMGLGRIGSEVAKRAQAFGMRVIAYDPYLRAEKALSMGVEVSTFDDVLKQSDFLTLHMPLTGDNKHLIGEKELAKMKKSARIINCARGGLIDERALSEALAAGKIAGAALDVFESEPPKDTTVLQHPNLVATPHLGASTDEAQIAVAVEVVQSILDQFSGKGTRNAVNIPMMDPEMLEWAKPYLHLAEKLGGLAGQILDGQILQVDIHYIGALAERETTPVTLSVLKGLLTVILGENVNFVNASVLARDRGIRITESKSASDSHYANLIRIDIRTDKKRTRVAGTVFTREDSRIVMIDDFNVEAVPDGYLLMIANRDVPGIVGQIGTLLGNKGVNIAGMTLGRDVMGGQARTILKIDGAVPEGVLSEIRKAHNILDAKLIKL